MRRCQAKMYVPIPSMMSLYRCVQPSIMRSTSAKMERYLLRERQADQRRSSSVIEEASLNKFTPVFGVLSTKIQRTYTAKPALSVSLEESRRCGSVVSLPGP